MRLFISDAPDLPQHAGDKWVLPGSANNIRHCIGCFACWVQTPGRCVLNDGYQNMGEYFGHSTELILISECVYGSFSPFVKNVLDRSISYILPHFLIRDGEMHHRERYPNHLNITAHFYGADLSEKEKNTATGIMRANANNFSAKSHQAHFYPSIAQIREVLA